MIVYDACRLVRERIPDAAQGQGVCILSPSGTASCAACALMRGLQQQGQLIFDGSVATLCVHCNSSLLCSVKEMYGGLVLA